MRAARLALLSLLRLGAAVAASAASEDVAQIAAALRGCPIVYVIHIPKTAGTALVSVLKQSPRWLQLRRAGVYVGHGKDFGEPQWRQIRDRRRATNGSVVVAEEIGLGDLAMRHYPFFGETCAVAVLRAPAAWLGSAMLHLRVGFDAVEARRLFFDVDDVQRTMVTGAPVRALVLAALERPGAVDALLSALPLGAPAVSLPVANRCADRRDRRPCHVYTPAERARIDAVVARRYAGDARLYARVNGTRAGLLLAPAGVDVP